MTSAVYSGCKATKRTNKQKQMGLSVQADMCVCCGILWYTRTLLHLYFRTQLEQKEEAYKNKGIITGQAAQQQIAAGNTAGAITTLENELQEAKVC